MTSGKLIGIIAIGYMLYYIGNIIYDLFLKKENNAQNQEDGEEFLAYGEENNIQNIEQDDVENIHTPSSYIQNDIEAKKHQEQDWNEQMHQNKQAEFKKKWEEENILENTQGNQKHPLQEEFLSDEEFEKQAIQQKKELEKMSSKYFQDFMQDIGTRVQCTKNIDGFKVFA